MFSSDPRVLALEIACLVLGIAVTTGGGLLALLADTDRPLQCVPICLLSGAVFLGGLGLLCWYKPIATEIATRAFPETIALLARENPRC